MRYLDGDRLTSSRDFEIIYEDGVSILIINEVFAEDEGEYTCEAINALGKAATSAFLHVQGSPPPSSLPSPPTHCSLL